MPLPKGANDPVVRAAWIAERQVILAAFDRAIASGKSATAAAVQQGKSVAGIQRMRASVERMANGGTNGRETSDKVDLGLALLSLVCQPNVPLTQDDIAAWCGVSRSAIYHIEMRAMRKVRNRLVSLCGPEIMEQIHALFGRKGVMS